MAMLKFNLDFLIVSTMALHKQAPSNFPPVSCLKLVQATLPAFSTLKQAVDYCLQLERTCRAIDKGHLIRQCEHGVFVLENGDRTTAITDTFLESCNPEWASQIKATIKNWDA